MTENFQYQEVQKQEAAQGFILVDVVAGLAIISIASLSFYNILQISLDYSRRAGQQFELLQAAKQMLIDHEMGLAIAENENKIKTKPNFETSVQIETNISSVNQDETLIPPDQWHQLGIKKINLLVENPNGESIHLSRLVIMGREE